MVSHLYLTLHIIERPDITLGDILEFLSGASELPAAGFSKKNPIIYFCNEVSLPAGVVNHWCASATVDGVTSVHVSVTATYLIGNQRDHGQLFSLLARSVCY